MVTLQNNLGLYAGVLALVLSIYCFWQILFFNKLKKTFFSGSTGVDLENIILSLKDELKDSRAHQDVLEQALTQLKSDSNFAVQKLGLVRFNPFSDGGGNFSFSLVLLDAHNTGAVITSMYGREQNRIYTKKITNGKSDTQLTEEEQQAIILAQNKTKPDLHN
jgi:hypothetical protein